VRKLEATLRMTLIASLFGAFMYGVTVWIIAPLGLISIAATAELAVRPYATNAADRLLLACGSIVTTLILVGLALNLTPWGLTRTTWNAAWLIVSISVLAWRRRLATNITNIRLPWAETRSLSVWIATASLILIAAVILALAGVRISDRQPVLALSVVSRNTDSVVVEIEATSITGEYQIMATSRAPKALQYSSGLLTIKAGSNGEQVRTRVPLNVAGTWTIDLESAYGDAIIRWLKVDLN
jgi:hypothetical protein